VPPQLAEWAGVDHEQSGPGRGRLLLTQVSTCGQQLPILGDTILRWENWRPAGSIV